MDGVDPLVRLEISNPQNLFRCEALLRLLGADSRTVNSLLGLTMPYIGEDFSGLNEGSKVLIFFLPGSAVVVAFRPKPESKDAFLNAFQGLGFPFSEEESWVSVLLSRTEDGDLLSGIWSDNDLKKKITTPTANPGDPFKVEFFVKGGAVAGFIPNPDISAFFRQVMELEVAVEFCPGGIAGSVSGSVVEGNPLYRLFRKENYTTPPPPVAFGQNEALSWLVLRDLDRAFDLFSPQVSQSGVTCGYDKWVVDGLKNALDYARKSMEGGQISGLTQHGDQLCFFGVGGTSFKTPEECVAAEDSLRDFGKKVEALSEKMDQGGALSVPVAGSEKLKAEGAGVAGPVNAPRKAVEVACVHRGLPIYVRERKGENEPFPLLYLFVRDGILFSSDSLEFLKFQIDNFSPDIPAAEKTSAANKTPRITTATLVGELPDGVALKGKFNVLSWLQFLRSWSHDLKSCITDALLAGVDSAGEVNFEATVQRDGSATLRFFANNGCLEGLLVLMTIFGSLADLNRGMIPFKAGKASPSPSLVPIKNDSTPKNPSLNGGMIPAKGSKAPSPGLTPVKNDSIQKKSPLVPVRGACNIGTCREDRQILIPMKILTEYKAMG
jgi:hypothetical protein